MSTIYKTQSGTVIVSGIEFNQHPPPSSLIKATEMKWARKLRNDGIIRLTSFDVYRQIENPELGDRNEGVGVLNVNGHPMTTSSANEVFIWCCAESESSPEVLKGFDPSYDAILSIHDVEKLTKRIVQSAKFEGYSLTPHLGKVIYNRGEEVSKEVLNDQQWHSNVFQKHHDYSHQQEYRLSFSNFTFNKIDQQYLDLKLGDCSNIITIE